MSVRTLKKILNSKILSLGIAGMFLLNCMGYGMESPDKSNLRVPMMVGEKERIERIKELREDVSGDAALNILTEIERLIKNSRRRNLEKKIPLIKELYTAIRKSYGGDWLIDAGYHCFDHSMEAAQLALEIVLASGKEFTDQMIFELVVAGILHDFQPHRTPEQHPQVNETLRAIESLDVRGIFGTSWNKAGLSMPHIITLIRRTDFPFNDAARRAYKKALDGIIGTKDEKKKIDKLAKILQDADLLATKILLSPEESERRVRGLAAEIQEDAEKLVSDVPVFIKDKIEPAFSRLPKGIKDKYQENFNKVKAHFEARTDYHKAIGLNAEDLGFKEVNPEFKQWLEREMSPIDQYLLKKILSADESVMKVFSRGRVYIKWGETLILQSNEGRTVYLELEKPFGDISVLRIKGVRPRREEGNEVADYAGQQGLVRRVRWVNSMGNIILGGMNAPQGTMLSEDSQKEYNIMQAALQETGYATDFPLAWGVLRGLSFRKDEVGFVIAGMVGEDIRLNVLAEDNEIPLVVLDSQKSGPEIDKPLTLDQAKKIYSWLGSSLRAYHDKGHFHRYPHFGNIGVKIDKEGLPLGVIFRDLETTVSRTGWHNIRRNTVAKRRREAGYRLMDIMKIIYDLSGRKAGVIGLANMRPLLESFYQGYFSATWGEGTEYQELLLDAHNQALCDTVMKLAGVHPTEELNRLNLSSEEPSTGFLWKRLYEITPALNPSVGAPKEPGPGISQGIRNISEMRSNI